MTGVQLGLLAASLIVHREPWVLPNPPQSHAQNQSDCSGEDCIQFSPIPPEPRAGRTVKAAMVLNFPAVFLGAFLEIGAGLLHFRTGEPSLLGFSAVFVPVIWYRVGKWLDAQSLYGNVGRSALLKVNSAWTLLARVLVWFVFAMMVWAFFFERHHHGDATSFMIAIWIFWTGAYLAAGLWGDWRRSSRRRTAVG